MVGQTNSTNLAGQQNESKLVGQMNGSSMLAPTSTNGFAGTQNGFHQHQPDATDRLANRSSAPTTFPHRAASKSDSQPSCSCTKSRLVGHHLCKATSLDQNSRFESVLNKIHFKEYWNQEGVGGDWFDDKLLLTLILPIAMSTGGLARAIKVMEEKSLQIVHMESRPSKKADFDLDILVQIKLEDGLTGESIVRCINEQGFDVAEFSQSHAMLIPRAGADDQVDDGCADGEGILAKVPWFPRKISDLDTSSKRVLMYGTDLDADHPGFKDPVYRQRRMLFAEIALNYKQGQPIPSIERTAEEIETWATIYKELRKLHKKYACKEYLENFELLEKYCGYGESSIPLLNDVSNFLRAKTGFQVRPVAGYLSSRDFLAGLAFRVFHCTQYIRHPADPFYSPEPDTCHELLGHMPLFADPDFAQFSQEIGLASLGASEDDVQKLATMYFFTVEFGLCRQEGELKVYGAGLLSSVGELKHAIEDKPEILPFDPDRVIQQECLITTFQTAYFYTESFEEAQQKIRTFVNNMKRPFVLRYDAYTESIEILNNKRSITLAINSLRSDINLLANALHKLL